MKEYPLNNFTILEYEELSSTNTEAARLLESRLTDKTVVVTYKQTQGRGQGTNSWESEAGKNLSLSVVLRPQQLNASEQFAVSMVISLACMDFIKKYTDACSIKWPNDIYVGDKKIGGILIEHRIAGSNVASSICGIGLNINQEQFYSDAPNPVSLFQLTGTTLPLKEALGELLNAINERYDNIDHYASLEKDYLLNMYRREGIHSWRDESGRFEASIDGIDEYGRLVLKDNAGIERVYGFKEVEFIASCRKSV
ncbi:biotin--[acetyl-CoA-carboxylase] ligase [Odoribacter sp. OttesenSCG-928-J03]|nr:biotin--[acetyl-CoA-carboxylase] ligase [Odoribacter sp. OttesenSCG-928-J03]